MIEVKELCKHYGGHTAIENISFTIEKGHVYGLLGPNGAGKSTTMNIITGCLAASSGQALIDGHDIFEESKQAKRLIGYLPETPPLYQDMTVEEYLYFVADAKEVGKAEKDAQVESAMVMTAIDGVAGRLIKHLSKGYRQRVGIAQALIGNPEVIILDEPTVGLDPKQIIEIRQLIRKLGEEHTVVLSSHILSEVRSICDRIIIISGGHLMANDTPENLERLFAGTQAVEAVVRASRDEVQHVAFSMPEVTGVTYTPLDGPDALPGTAKAVFTTESKEDIGEKLFFRFAQMRRPIVRLAVSKASLEDVFLELTDSEKAEAAMQAGAQAEARDGASATAKAGATAGVQPETEEVSGDDGHTQA